MTISQKNIKIVGTSRTTRLTLIIGAITMFIGIHIGYFAFNKVKSVHINNFYSNNLNIARAVKIYTEKFPSQEDEKLLLIRLESYWRDIHSQAFPGSYLCAIKNTGTLALHTDSPKLVGTNIGHIPITDMHSNEISTIRALVNSRHEWVGSYITKNNEKHVLASSYSPHSKYIISIHMPIDKYISSVNQSILPWVIGYLLLLFIGLPTSLGILNYAYIKTQKNVDRIQRELEFQKEKTQQSDRMKSLGRVATGVAHDFNNILTVIIGYAELIRVDVLGNKKIIQHTDSILLSTDKGKKLVSQIRTLSMKKNIIMVPVNINSIILDIEEMVRHLLKKNITYEFTPDRHLPMIKSDKGEIERIFINLLSNANDAMPDGGTINITTLTTREENIPEHHQLKRKEAYAKIIVSDTGIGMDQEILDHIFEPYFTTKSEEEGTGIGLSNVYNIIERCSGDIFVESHPGTGTTFYIYFPALST